MANSKAGIVKLLKIIPWIAIAAVVYFFATRLLDNLAKLDEIQFGFDFRAIIGALLMTSAVLISGVLWASLLGVLVGTPISWRDGVRVHSASWLLKYVPGQVGSLMNKLSWGHQHSISKKTITTSFLYENILTVLASVMLSLPVAWLFQDRIGGHLITFLPILFLLPMLVVLYKPLFYRLLNLVFAVLKREPFKESDFLSSPRLISFFLYYHLPRLLNGVGFVLIALSLLEVDSSMYVGLAALYIFACVIGLLTVFVPGGIGVREAVIVLFATAYFPVEQAIVLSIVARFYATLSDAGVAMIYFILNNGRLRQV